MRRLWVLVSLCTPLHCAGALPDEIEVFDDALAQMGRTQTTIHVNTSPAGRTSPDFPGEVVPNRTWRAMLELAHGMREGLELGVHIPFLIDRDGRVYAAGVRPRMRWIPKRTPHGSTGSFYGLNLEYSEVGRRFERPQRHLELKPIVGWRGSDWLLAANPAFTAWLSDAPKPNPEFSVSAMLKRHLGNTNYAGIEYYSNYGPLGNFSPASRRDRAIFLGADSTVFKEYRVNVGIGRGLTPHSDHTVLKIIMTLPY